MACAGIDLHREMGVIHGGSYRDCAIRICAVVVFIWIIICSGKNKILGIIFN